MKRRTFALAVLLVFSLLCAGIPNMQARAEYHMIALVEDAVEDYFVMNVGDVCAFYIAYDGEYDDAQYRVSDPWVLSCLGMNGYNEMEYYAMEEGSAVVMADLYKGTEYVTTVSAYVDVEDYGYGDDEPELADVSNATLSVQSITDYVDNSTYNYGYYNRITKTISIKGMGSVVLNEYDNCEFECSCTNSNISVYGRVSNNKIELELYGYGKGTLNLTINGKTFKVSINLIRVKLNATGALLATGTTKQLKVTNVTSGIKWKSSNTKAVSVSSQGVVKAKTTGNALITAKIGNVTLGCVVSSVPQKIKNVVARGQKIGQTCTYSQAKRMQDGYYDCSSLVWKSYSKYGVYFGSKNWAPTSGAEAKWCKNNKRVIKGGYSYNKVQKLEFLPGDVVFKSDSSSKPYDTVYHVEMIAGYEFGGFDYYGQPYIMLAWANRGTGYGAAEGAIVGRPYCKMP